MGVKTRNLSNTVGLDIEWQGVQTGNFTAVAGKGYFVDTTSASITVTLPGSPSQGDTVVLKDYARTWGTNAVSTSSALFDGDTLSQSFSTNGQTVTLIYMDGTKGWSLVNEDTTSSLGSSYITATGGTIATSGDFKVHTFTGDGCFVVSAGNGPLAVVDYLVVGGGAGGGGNQVPGCGGGGGGAGGFRVSNSYAIPAPTMSPLVSCTGVVSGIGTYPITVGGGGSGGGPNVSANPGSNSIFSTITSAGGGRAGSNGPGIPTPNNCASRVDGAPGGSGGGGAGGGTGNTPPTSPPQGNNGGTSPNAGPGYSRGGGGGAGAVGGNGTPTAGGLGGIGSYVSPTLGGCNGTTGPVPSVRYFAGGGGGSSQACGPKAGGAGGGGTSGVGLPATSGSPGSANTGGGGGGGGGNCSANGGNGGKGIVILRYRFQ